MMCGGLVRWGVPRRPGETGMGGGALVPDEQLQADVAAWVKRSMEDLKYANRRVRAAGCIVSS